MTIQSLFNSNPIYRRADLISIARKGIQTERLGSIKKYTSLTDKELIEILPISQRQLLRYSPDHVLNKEITSQLILIIELFQKGYDLFGESKFQLWIRTKNKVLNANKPIDLMDTAIGIEMIEDVIGRIEHGVLS